MVRNVFHLLLAVIVFVPTPFVSGLYHICSVSGHVHEDCSCSGSPDHAELSRQSCCDVHSTLELPAFMRGEQDTVTQSAATAVRYASDIVFPKVEQWTQLTVFSIERAPPPSGRDIRILHSSFLA